jgi:hypothetical protein
MFRFFISFFALFIVFESFSQTQKSDTLNTNKDSIIYKSPFGIRIGIDISKPIKAAVDGSYNGLEFVGDYRISKRMFIAAEIGFEEETTQEDYTNSTAKGTYARLGFNFNAYENWLDMNNEIFVGYRYGLSFFEQTLNSFTPNVNTTYFPANPIIPVNETANINAHWSEFMVGFKVETLKNFFISASVSYKVMMSVKEPDNFKTLFSPGFNRIFESGTGFGFNYTLSYLIPFTKR